MRPFAAILRKDLMLELRSGRTTTALVSLALLVLVVLAFALDRAIAGGSDAAAGAMWVALVFAGMLGATRVMLAEQENGCLRALLLSPVDRATLYAAKLAAAFIFMLGAALAAMILAILFFNLEFSNAFGTLSVALLLGALGFSALATLLAAISARARGGELLLPILIVPLFVPALIAGVKASASALSGAQFAAAGQWFGVLAAFDVLFVAAGYLLFEHVVGEE
ncbi:MAG TPA: heme exporter protein CcmB [Candidatus Binataceae bacterium]|nr:heme exporter protein CcmB [Candidatus Binataceae bacterium]